MKEREWVLKNSYWSPETIPAEIGGAHQLILLLATINREAEVTKES